MTEAVLLCILCFRAVHACATDLLSLGVELKSWLRWTELRTIQLVMFWRLRVFASERARLRSSCDVGAAAAVVCCFVYLIKACWFESC
ncbi:hypothetical protein TETLIM5_000088 [Candidatus Hodgkinia cicadicola]|nr:hypothetical protein TETLIM5_000088 [Candidatus Hodgkinia cicadicola]